MCKRKKNEFLKVKFECVNDYESNESHIYIS